MDEAFIKKVQPNSPEAEQSVIGAMIMDRDAIADVIDIVNADDFYQKQNGILFEAMTELYREGKPVDLVTLQNKLKKKAIRNPVLFRFRAYFCPTLFCSCVRSNFPLEIEGAGNFDLFEQHEIGA